jgi:hypothetical protein
MTNRPVYLTSVALLGAAGGWVIAEVLVTGDQPTWRAPACAFALAAAGLAATFIERWSNRGVSAGWALAAAIGMYLGVPETDHLVGVIAVLIVVWLAAATGRLRADFLVVAGLDAVLVWAAVQGASGSSGALLAALAMLGLLVLAPLIALLPRPAGELVPASWRAPVLVALQLAFCVTVARLGGVRTTTTEAAIVAATGLVALGAAAWLVIGISGKPLAGDESAVLGRVRS